MSLHDLYSILIPREEEIFEETIQRGGSLALIANSQRQTTSNDPQPSNSQAFETSDSSSDFSAFADAIALLTKTFEQRLRGGGQRYQRSDRRRMDDRSKEEVRSKDKGKAEVVCYKCKQKGHYASECKTKKLKDVAYYEKKLEEAKKQQQQVNLIAGTDTWLSDDYSDEEEEEMANFCLMALSDDIPETSGQQDRHVQQIWYCDSGSSKHMTGDRSLLNNFVSKLGKMVNFGNGVKGRIMGYGCIRYGCLTIERVAYVEGLKYNLLSCGQFCDKGFQVTFLPEKCLLIGMDDNKIYLSGKRIRQSIYYFDFKEENEHPKRCLFSKINKGSSWL
ncbi:putative RNA-directed DNA polymerase [Helianthus annuus]|nr:putative RNA-directed DNA polymerase [Helianthus annuus]